jgi:hypothetical protein
MELKPTIYRDYVGNRSVCHHHVRPKYSIMHHGSDNYSPHQRTRYSINGCVESSETGLRYFARA